MAKVITAARKGIEHKEQAALFKWAELNSKKYPALSMLYAIPNGGHRHIAVAKKLKAEGVKRGVPDVCLPVPMAEWHGLYIEMKTATGRLSTEQKEWIDCLVSYGYKAEVCRSWAQAACVISNYLGIAAIDG